MRYKINPPSQYDGEYIVSVDVTLNKKELERLKNLLQKCGTLEMVYTTIDVAKREITFFERAEDSSDGLVDMAYDDAETLKKVLSSS
jgi:hypothetical protein